jgi:hypothetical protein
LVVLFLSGWELWLRNKGVGVAYDDGPPLWADKRARVYAPMNEATVFIGSSRCKYDLDIDTWKTLAGDEPVQLAMEGSSPLPVLDDLANDERFRGKLVIDVTENLFFSVNPRNFNDPKKNISYFADRTPSDRASFGINKHVESRFVFLDRDNYSLTAFLDKLRLKDRPGVFSMPIFPMEFGRTSFERQAFMTPAFEKDTNLHRQVTDIWGFFRRNNKIPPASGKKLDSIFVAVKSNIDKIRARGGKVIFIRPPSSGPFWEGEQKIFPRENYWDALLKFTGIEGIHFNDYPQTAAFICPEWSHLKPSDAGIYTRELIAILKTKGWFNSNK